MGSRNFYSTATDTPVKQVLDGYAGRRSIEEAFQGSKSHFEESQGWIRQAVRRTASLKISLPGQVLHFGMLRHITRYRLESL